MLRAAVAKELGAFTLDVAFEAAGGTTVLFGPSGSGKSLTLAAIAGLLRPSRGRVEVEGAVLFDAAGRVDVPPERRRVGYVPQGYGLFPHLTVAENMAFGLRGVGRAEARSRVAEALELLRLGGLEARLPRQVSGGQAQRVALARALVTRPRVLLLDEPFAALDADIRRALQEELVSLQRRLGVTVVFVTHDQSEAHAVGDGVVVYDRGRVLQAGPIDDVFARPGTRRVAELTGTRNILAGRVVAAGPDGLSVAVGRNVVSTGPQETEVGASVALCIRPEHVLLVRQEKSPHYGERTNVLPGRIVRETRHGTHRTLYMRLEEPVLEGEHDLEVDLPEHAYEVMGVGERRDWRVSLKKSAIHLLPPGSHG